jgi:hypothetical protein
MDVALSNPGARPFKILVRYTFLWCRLFALLA